MEEEKHPLFTECSFLWGNTPATQKDIHSGCDVSHLTYCTGSGRVPQSYDIPLHMHCECPPETTETIGAWGERSCKPYSESVEDACAFEKSPDSPCNATECEDRNSNACGDYVNEYCMTYEDEACDDYNANRDGSNNNNTDSYNNNTMFGRMNTNRSGDVTEEEAKAYFSARADGSPSAAQRDFGITKTEEHVAAAFERDDANNSGHITWEEFSGPKDPQGRNNASRIADGQARLNRLLLDAEARARASIERYSRSSIDK